MKNRVVAILTICLIALGLSISPAYAAEGDGVSTQIGDMVLSGNCGGNYVRGNGVRHSPASSWLYANEKGGVTLVKYVSAKVGVTVAEFDEELNFLNTRTLAVDGIQKWGGFYAGETYNYVIYTTGRDVLHIDQYSKDWAFKDSTSYTLGNTNSLISNDLDITEGGGSLYIASNHFMTNGHQANFRLQISAETLALQVEQTGTASYPGYCSHSYVPEVVYSGGTVYAFDRCDSVPGTAIYMSVFGGSLSSGNGMRSVKSMRFNDWGSQGNAIPAANGGVLTAYTFANWNQDSTSTDVYLYYASPSNYGTHTRVSYTGGAGTPYVMAVTDTYGYVLWNTDLYDNTQAEDNLYYAVYTINSGNISVGPVRKVENNYLSDCEPILWDGGLLWFTYGSKELSFHQIDATGKVSKKVNHNIVTVPGKAASCTSTGLTDGEKCSVCGEVFVEQQILDMLPHVEVKTDYVAPTFTTEGYTEGIKCDVCGEQLSGHEVIPKIQAEVKSAQVENGKLHVAYLGAHPAFVAVAYYDEAERCIGVQVTTAIAQEESTAFTILEGSRSYRVILTDAAWRPQCDAYNGQF